MTQTNRTARLLPTRRTALALSAGGLFAMALPGTGIAQASGAAQQIADHFTRVRTMMGEFVQFGPNGEQTGGKFFIERPGRVLFLYEEPSNIRVVADGRSVVVNNKKLDTWDAYSLGQTPLKLVLADRIDLSDGKVKQVIEDDDLTTIVLQDRQVFGDSTITMMFDPQSYDLRQWTIRDAQGKDTTVMIYNVREGVTFGDGTFDIDYGRVRRSRNNNNNN